MTDELTIPLTAAAVVAPVLVALVLQVARSERTAHRLNRVGAVITAIVGLGAAAAMLTRESHATSWVIADTASGIYVGVVTVIALMSALMSGDWPHADASERRHQVECSGLVAAYLQWHLEHSIRSLKPGGRLVVSGATSGDAPPAELTRVFFLQLSVIGSTMGTRDELQRLIRFCLERDIRPTVHRTMPLAEARDGFRELLEGEVVGKIVFTT